jgi:predicted ArsR family transcriptional regulator
MKTKTIKLIATMAEPGADALLGKLRAGPRTESELRAATGLSHRATHERLAALERVGLVAATLRATSTRGRPPKEWRLTQAEQVARFGEQAEALAATLKPRRA